MENLELSVEIKKLGINAEGIAYYNNKTIFIDNALPKEVVVIKIIEDNKTFLRGKIIKFIKQSELRVKPFCEHYDRCGGCNLQHIKYEATAKIKKDLLCQAIEKYSSLNPRHFQVHDTVLMENPLNYRNKSQLVIYGDNKLKLGLYEVNSKEFVEINTCYIQNELLNIVNMQILNILEKYKLKSVHFKGNLKNLVTRISSLNNEIQVTIIVEKDDPKIDYAAKEIINLSNVVSVYKSINTSGVSMFSDIIKLEGNDVITEIVNEYKYNLLPNSFFQLNTKQTQKLHLLIKKIAKLSLKENVIDAFCGVGTIGISLSSVSKKVIGIEQNESAIKNANNNLILNKIKNVSFITGDATKEIAKISENEKFDVLVFDPPRTGLTKEILTIVNKELPSKIIYVSCNPSTLGKDLNILKENYNVKQIYPLDMFPFTAHIESIVLLTIK